MAHDDDHHDDCEFTKHPGRYMSGRTCAGTLPSWPSAAMSYLDLAQELSCAPSHCFWTLYKILHPLGKPMQYQVDLAGQTLLAINAYEWTDKPLP